MFTQGTILRPVQNRGEFVRFLDLVREQRPASVLEIGTAQGGTFFMICQVAPPDARLVTLDLRIPSAGLVRSFARSRQSVVPLEGDSRSVEVRSRVGAHFPDGLDLLFIDGDHSFEGVAADFDAYAPLVRPGGLVVFHDIVADNFQRTGVSTGGDSGGVPQYWREFRARTTDDWETHEFVESWEQDGRGIGVAVKPGG